MCFNISLLSPINWELLVEDTFSGYDMAKAPIYHSNAFTNPLHPLLCMDRKGVHILSRWGLVPRWSKDREQALMMRRSCYNARGETIFSKPAFRSAARDSRCLVPVTGFFEFREVSGKKFPYHVRMRDGRTFYLGGIFEDTGLLSGGLERTFSIVTTEANELMSFVHNTKKRMPLVLPTGLENEWLGADRDQKTLQEMVLPYPGNDLEAYPVTKDLLRKGGLKDPSDTIKRVDYPELEQSSLDGPF